jgi:hypothetical protein
MQVERCSCPPIDSTGQPSCISRSWLLAKFREPAIQTGHQPRMTSLSCHVRFGGGDDLGEVPPFGSRRDSFVIGGCAHVVGTATTGQSDACRGVNAQSHTRGMAE